MSNYDADVPVARGRRDPHIASMLDAEEAELMEDETSGDVGNEAPEYSLLPGDMIMGKTTLAYKTQLGDAWSTFGAQTHLMQGEGIDEAFDRLAVIVNSGAIAISEDANDRVNEIVQRQNTQRIRGQR